MVILEKPKSLKQFNEYFKNKASLNDIQINYNEIVDLKQINNK